MTEGTDLVTISPEAEVGRELAPYTELAPVVYDSAHPGPRQYVIIAIVLVILTGVEVATSYLEGTVNSNLLIVALALMAATKFFLVAAWYMHMKQDSRLFRRLFIMGLTLATIVYGIVMLFFSSTVLKS